MNVIEMLLRDRAASCDLTMKQKNIFDPVD